MKKIKLFSLFAAALFAGSAMAASYIPQGVKEVTKNTIVYAADVPMGNNYTPASSWIGCPTTNNINETNKAYTNVTNDATGGNPKGLTDNMPSASGVTMSKLATDKVYNSAKKVVHMHVKGISEIIVHGLTGSNGRGMAIGCNEFTSTLTADSEIPTSASIQFATDKKGSFIVNLDRLDSSKEYIISIWAVGGDAYFYAAELIAASATEPGAPTLKSIAIDGELNNTKYSEGAEVDYSGLSVRGTYSNNDSTGTVERGIVWSIAPELAVGTTDYTITATVGELKATKDVKLTVTAVVLESLAFKGSLNLASCYVGEPLNLAGLTVEAVYSNGIKKDVTAEASITTDEITKSDTVTITASYGELIATQKAYIYVCKRPSTTGTVLLSYEHTDNDTALTGIELGSGLSIGSTNIHTNKDKANGIKLDGGYVNKGKYLPEKGVSLSVEGGFKASDEIVVAAFFNNTDNTKQAQVDIFTLNADSTTTTLHTIGQAVNGRLVDNDPFEAVYTLTEDADTIRLGRFGGTATYIYTIKVIRPKSDVGSAFDQTQVETKAVKVIRDGQLLIIREGKTYTAQGVQVQ